MTILMCAQKLTHASLIYRTVPIYRSGIIAFITLEAYSLHAVLDSLGDLATKHLRCTVKPKNIIPVFLAHMISDRYSVGSCFYIVPL